MSTFSALTSSAVFAWLVRSDMAERDAIALGLPVMFAIGGSLEVDLVFGICIIDLDKFVPWNIWKILSNQVHFITYLAISLQKKDMLINKMTLLITLVRLVTVLLCRFGKFTERSLLDVDSSGRLAVGLFIIWGGLRPDEGLGRPLLFPPSGLFIFETNLV